MRAAARPVPVWWVRAVGPDLVTVHGYSSDDCPDGSVTDAEAVRVGQVPTEPPLVRIRMRTDTRQVIGVKVTGAHVDPAPGLVYVERIDRTTEAVSVHLVALMHDDVARRAHLSRLPVVSEGAVLTPSHARWLGITPADEVGTVRWNPNTGQVLEVSVVPAHRRRRVATKLLFVAEAFTAARDWPRLWAGGVRTAMGQALADVWGWGVGRVARLTHVAPPLAPPAVTTRRYLESGA